MRLHFRLTYFEDINTLIIKISTIKHEMAHLMLGLKIHREIVLMGMKEKEFSPIGATKNTRSE